MHVARVALVPDGTDAYLGFGHVLFREAGGVEHGLGGSLGCSRGQFTDETIIQIHSFNDVLDEH